MQHHGARWNVIRDRIACSIHETLTDRVDNGTLSTICGAIEVRCVCYLRSRDRQNHNGVVFGDCIGNCTGRSERFFRSQSPLFDNLQRRGVGSLDAPDLGRQVNDDFVV